MTTTHKVIRGAVANQSNRKFFLTKAHEGSDYPLENDTPVVFPCVEIEDVSFPETLNSEEIEYTETETEVLVSLLNENYIPEDTVILAFGINNSWVTIY